MVLLVSAEHPSARGLPPQRHRESSSSGALEGCVSWTEGIHMLFPLEIHGEPSVAAVG